MYKEIKNPFVIDENEIYYNFFYSKFFTNSNLKTLYKNLEIVQNSESYIENSNKCFSFVEIIKIIDNFKKNILKPMLTEIHKD